jgi:hypothetical protein
VGEFTGVDATGQALLNSLNAQRAHVIGILDGLAPESLFKPVLPSGWSCLGLVQHLALDVERFWFQLVVAGGLSEAGPDGDGGSAWELAADATPEAVFALYREEIDLADRIITSTPLDGAPLSWPVTLFGDWRLADLRAILLHVITETACHAGHLDTARELLDGRTWLVL